MHFPFSFWKSSGPTPQAMYFTDMGSGLWADSANWFDDSGYITPAGRTPISGDEVWMGSQFTDNAPSLTLVSYNGTGPAAASQTQNLHVSGGIYMSAGVWGGSNDNGAVGYFSGTAEMASSSTYGTEFTGNCGFHDSSLNSGYISVGGYFYDTSASTGNINTAYFSDYSVNSGTVNDGGTFYQYSTNSSSGVVSATIGTISFHDGSVNYGTCNDVNVDFYDNAQNGSSGACGYSATFHDWTTNYASYLGMGTFYDYAGDFGSTYSGYYNGNSSTQGGNITSYAYFNDSAVNNSENYYDAQFTGTSYNLGVCDLTASFYGYSYNDGTVHDVAAFYDSASNASAGVVNDNFSASHNLFSGSSLNYGIAYYHTDMTDYSINYAFAGQGNFSGHAENASGAHANIMAYFIDDSVNNGTTNADADFDGNAVNNGYVTGLAQFFGNSSNYGTYGTISCSTTGTCP